MKSIYVKLVIGVLLLLGLGCNAPKPMVVEHTITKEVKVTEKIHDTVVKVAKDFSYYKAYLECKNGEVKIRDETVQTKPGRNLKSPEVSLQNNTLLIDCEQKAHDLFIQWKEKHIKETSQRTIPYKVNELTFWQQFQIKGFQLLLILLGGFTLFKLLKFSLKYYGKNF